MHASSLSRRQLMSRLLTTPGWQILRGALVGGRTVATTLLRYLRRCSALDVRSLALFRVLLASLGLWDVLNRMHDPLMPFPEIYSDIGPQPRDLNVKLFGQLKSDLHGYLNERLAIHYCTGSTLVIRLIFALHLLALLALLVGYRTRTAHLLVKLCHDGMFYRVPYANHSGDLLFRLICFWSLFLPLGEAFSIDSLLRREHSWMFAQGNDRTISSPTTKPPVRGSRMWPSFTSLASFGYICQVFLVYELNGLQKTGKDWRESFTAVYFALAPDWQRRPVFGDFVYQHLPLSKLLTRMALALELFGPPLFFVPTPAIRFACVVTFVLFQFGLFCCMQALWMFPRISSTMVVPLLPSAFWDNWVLRADMSGARSTASLVRSLGERAASWAGGLPTSHGQQRVAMAYSSTTSRTTFTFLSEVLGCVFVISCIFYICMENAHSLKWVSKEAMEPLQTYARPLGIDQRWNMYAPFPARVGGWSFVKGHLADGSEVDVVDMMRHRFKQSVPAKPMDMRPGGLPPFGFGNKRSYEIYGRSWRFFYWTLYATLHTRKLKDRAMYVALGKYVCSQWNSKAGGWNAKPPDSGPQDGVLPELQDVRFTYKDVSLREDYRHHYSQNMEYVIAFVPCPNTGRRDDIVVRRALEDMERGARSASFGVNSVDPPGTRWREALLQGEYTSGNATTRLPDFLPY